MKLTILVLVGLTVAMLSCQSDASSNPVDQKSTSPNLEATVEAIVAERSSEALVSASTLSPLQYIPNLYDLKFGLHEELLAQYGSDNLYSTLSRSRDLDRDLWKYIAVYVAQECLEARPLSAEGFQLFARQTVLPENGIYHRAKKVLNDLVNTVKLQGKYGDIFIFDAEACLDSYIYPETPEEGALAGELMTVFVIGGAGPRFREGIAAAMENQTFPWFADPNLKREQPLLLWLCSQRNCP